MSTPTSTPNPATRTRPARSSRRVAHKKPLGWLPWALLGLLALLLAVVLLAINAVDDDGPDGPAGDSLGQVDSNGSGLDGADGNGQIAGTEDGTGSSGTGSSGTGSSGTGSSGTGSSGTGSSGTGSSGTAGSNLAALAGSALVGGAGIDPAPAGSAGTAAAREAGTAGTVLFAEDSSALDPSAQQVVARAAQSLRDARATRVEVLGYTDIVAGAPVNQPLSQERADSVASALRSQLPGVDVSAVGRGQEDPVASNDTDDGRQQNRRAAIVARG